MAQQASSPENKGFGQGDAVRRMFSQSGSTAVEVERDLAGIERVVVVRRG